MRWSITAFQVAAAGTTPGSDTRRREAPAHQRARRVGSVGSLKLARKEADRPCARERQKRRVSPSYDVAAIRLLSTARCPHDRVGEVEPSSPDTGRKHLSACEVPVPQSGLVNARGCLRFLWQRNRRRR